MKKRKERKGKEGKGKERETRESTFLALWLLDYGYNVPGCLMLL